MKKEKKIVADKAKSFILNESSIPQSLKLLYLEADASLLQLMRAKRRIDSVFLASGVTTKESPELGALKNYYSAVKQACYFFDEFISKSILSATWDVNEGERKTQSYDTWLANANSLARMTLLFCDRTCNDGEQMMKIFEFMKGLESHHLFDEKDFDYFNVKYPVYE